MRKRLRAVLLAVGATTLALSAHASTFVSLSLDDLVDRSGAVVVGVAGTRVSQWESGRIYSYTEVTVDASVAGGPKTGEVVVVRTIGGEVNGIGQVATGEATLAPKSRAVLFLKPLQENAAPLAPASFASGGRWIVTGMSQGEMPVYQDSDFKFRVTENPSEAVIVEKAGHISAQKHFKGALLTEAMSEIQATWRQRAKK